MSLCELHLMLAVQTAQELGLRIAPPRIVKVPVFVPISESWKSKMARNAEPIPTREYQVVYYLQFGDRVKIGTTTNLPERLKAIPHDRVLAIEPGGFLLENRRHVEFAIERIHGEWFRLSSRLGTHIESLRETYGEAIESWTARPEVNQLRT